jgi:ATP adenylyltransferase
MFIIMNKFPYNNGHLMVVPYRHVSEVEELKKAEHAEMMRLLCLCKKVLFKTCRPHGFNIGINQGRVAGAGIDEHIHAHILPRWNGDTNFMPTLAQTKVISISMQETYKILKKHFKKTG